MILAAALLAGAAARPVVRVPLSERVSDVASRFCVDLLSGAIPVPGVGEEEQRVFARYGLTPGIPNVAMQALGSASTNLIARATLASGDASDGAFIVALGGAAGGTCRVIVYRAPVESGFVQRAGAAMIAPAHRWKALPSPAQSPVATRLSFLKRDAAGRPFIANLIAPRTSGAIAMIANVAVIPPNVTLPQGY